MSEQEPEISLLPPKESDEFFRCSICYKGMKRPTNAACAIVDRGEENDFVIWIVVAKYGCHFSAVCQDCLLDLIGGRVGKIKIQWVGEDDDILWKMARQGRVYRNNEQ